MTEQVGRALTVVEVEEGGLDQAGDPILKVYTYNPPDYAIYRTRDRLIVQYSEKPDLRVQQRARVTPLAPMRGQINGLIDGWRSADDDEPVDAAEGGSGGLFHWWRQRGKREQFRKVCRYDRRVADAIITALEDEKSLELAQTLLAQVKNDLISERTAIARGQYVTRAVLLLLAMVGITGLLASGQFDRFHAFAFNLTPAWTALAGGSIGAFFSIITGLKSRDVVIDLQNRENRIDVTLRMVIGAVAGVILYCLFAAGFVTTKLFPTSEIVYRTPHEVGSAYREFTVFLIGFVAGFSERLVPSLLSKTNFGTPEPAGQDTPVKKVSRPEAADAAGAGAKPGLTPKAPESAPKPAPPAI
jgi:hypothetical protein